MTEKENKPTALIFGATGGIGSALTKSLAASGYDLMLAARNEEPLQSLAQEMGGTACPTDVTQAEQVDACFKRAIEAFEHVDAVVLAVGSILIKPVHLTTDEEWQETINLNLTSAFNVVRAAARDMRTRGGSIVLFSSCAARRGLPNHEAIAAAKAGVIGLMLSAAATYASQGLRVNCIAPGLVRTPMSESLTSSEAKLKYSTALHPLGRIGDPEDIVPPVKWLLSSEASWVTGQIIGIDGGLASVQSR